MENLSAKEVKEQIVRKKRADEIADMKLRILALEVEVEKLQKAVKRETPALLEKRSK